MLNVSTFLNGVFIGRVVSFFNAENIRLSLNTFHLFTIIYSDIPIMFYFSHNILYFKDI